MHIWTSPARYHDNLKRAQCFDRDRFTRFIEQHENQGRELFAGDCGEEDRAQAGWCPGGAP